MRILILLLICFCLQHVNAQKSIDKIGFKPHEKAIRALQKNEILNRTDLFAIYDFYSENNYDSLYYYSNKIIEVGIKYENWDYINCGKAFMVSFFNNHSKIDIATQLGQQSLEYYMNTADYEMITYIQNQIGISYTLSKDYTKAKIWYLKSIESGKLTGDFKENSVGLKNIAELHYRKGEYDSALVYINTFIKLIDNNKNQIATGKAYNILGNIYKEKGENEQAIFYYEKSLSSADNKESAIIKGNAYSNLAIMYFEENPNLARSYFFKALQSRQKINIPPIIADSYLNLGHWYFAMGKLDSALYYYKYMIDYCVKNRCGDAEIEGYDAIRNYYETLKDKVNVQLFSNKLTSLSLKLKDDKQKSLDQYIEKTNMLFLAEENLIKNGNHLGLSKKFDHQMDKLRSIVLIILLSLSVIGIGYYVYKRRNETSH